MDSSRCIALYGGSFDPPHPAHLAIARAAVLQAQLDQVIFLPAAQSPLKARGPVASGAQRVEMLQAALTETGADWGMVSEEELQRPGPSYSWQTAEHFTRQGRADTRWFWLMGVDQWQQLERWQRWQLLAESVTFLVFSRDGLIPTPREGVKAIFLTGEFHGSSTGVRTARQEGADWESLVAPGVAEVIRRERLYLE